MLGNSRIIGTGSALPPHEIDNDALMPIIASKHPDAKPRQWSEQVFGVYRRRRSFDYDRSEFHPGCRDGELALRACVNALESAKLSADDIDFIIYATGSPEHIIDPDPVMELHRNLNCKTECGGITVPITCTGLVDAVIIADGLIRAGTVNTALLVATNVLSAYADQSWEFMFNAGDAAAALVLSGAEGDDRRGILDTFLRLHPSDRAVRIRRCGTHQFCAENEDEMTGLHAEMYLDQVVLDGLPMLEALLDMIVDRHPKIMEDIDWLVAHQATGLLQHHLAHMTGVPVEKIPFHVGEYGNTMAASTGVVIDTLNSQGMLKRDDLILVVAVGTSWRCAAYLMKW